MVFPGKFIINQNTKKSLRSKIFCPLEMFQFAKNSRVDNLSRKVFAIDGYKIFNNLLKNNEFSSIAEL